ncbi:type II toxin-antitoxin system RelB/DinJ family antitoxin [Arabiibacter massiliensis]|uniref:type II toxin-antitoxin system RelB/DinJ family antitoxin n=1 Tax=Arabiibacter massiliensis TaxID=1870985 RepID=UPI00155AE8C4|nr:type II toxin-antitoxin system RelB/DinJ family antitoxin [Arabiibacter massiliensis]
MAKEALLQVRIDPQDKRDAEQLYASMGTSLSEAVRMFVNQSLLDQRMPFTPTSLNKKGSGRAYGVLNVFASPTKREQERDAWIASLSMKAESELRNKK